jgi:hypothetical protein
VALIIVLFGVAVLLAQIAPSRVTSGVYQVTVGEGADQFTIPTESLTCGRIGATATCTTPVSAHQLRIDVRYLDADIVGPSSCTARYDERSVSCESAFGDYGHASHSVRISDGLGVTGAELAGLRAAVPWWRSGYGVEIAAKVLICTLSIAAGVATYLLRRRARPVPAEWRSPVVIGTGVLALGLFVASGLVLDMHNAWVLVLSPFTVLAAGVLTAWQGQLSGMGARHNGRPWPDAIGAVLAVALYTTVAMFAFLLQSAFID